MKTGWRIAICIAAAAALLGIVLPDALCKGEEEVKPEKVPLILNEVLQNEMSDLDELKGLDDSMKGYLKKWGIHGASFAIMKNDSLVYAKGYGSADKDGTPVQPYSLFRIASVSKLITSVGIMILQERGELNISDKVFAPGGIMGDESFTSVITDNRYYDITIEHLLRHSAGFSSGAGDPMFSTRELMIRNRWSTPPDAATLSKYYLSHKLGFDPGTASDYSNYGYLLLSMIIEKVTGEDYETWMQENVLHPAGCYDMHIGQSSYELKYPNETRYFPYANEKTTLAYDNSGRTVQRVYGGNDIPALLGAGAWVASVPELARFIAAIDGRPEVPDIISLESMRQMTLPTDRVTYSIGWVDTKDTGEWTRTGTLSGTSALIKYYPEGECWIMVTNTGTYLGARFSNYTADQFNKSREEYSPLLPHRDLFYE